MKLDGFSLRYNIMKRKYKAYFLITTKKPFNQFSIISCKQNT